MSSHKKKMEALHSDVQDTTRDLRLCYRQEHALCLELHGER